MPWRFVDERVAVRVALCVVTYVSQCVCPGGSWTSVLQCAVHVAVHVAGCVVICFVSCV